MNDDLHRIPLKGGVTAPGELKDSIAMLEAAGLKEVFFGSRQDLLFPLPAAVGAHLEKSPRFTTDIIADRSYQNIVSSYVSADIFEMTHWLKGSTYLYILEAFDYLPKLKINITDPKQRLVPLFSGNLNFIASQSEDYWYLNIKLPHWETTAFYPVLVYSWDIHTFARAIENIHSEVADVDDLFFILNKQLDTNNKVMERELMVPYLTFPYYEGMNRMGADQFWLGLYWRNNRYNLDFLKQFCGFCLDNSVGKICITPWKSFIVKGIKSSSRTELERFLGQRGINVRHSQLEMNWHLPVDDAEALDLKKFLVENFDRNDISTYGLTFGISNQPGKRSHFSSIIIERNPVPAIVRDLQFRPSYNVLHFKDFDPNTQRYQTYAQEVDRMELPGLLMELSKNYFEQLGNATPEKKLEKKESPQPTRSVHQCKSCLTVYDPTYGDAQGKIPRGIPFEELSQDYTCPVCKGPLENFVPILMTVRA